MAITMGPVLHFRGAVDGEWRVSAIVVDDSAKKLNLQWSSGQSGRQSQAEGRIIGKGNSEGVAMNVWRFDFAIDQSDEAVNVSYKVQGGKPCEFAVPAKGANPQMVYASCNGFSDPKLMKKVANQNALWADVIKTHQAKTKPTYHLMLMGGDQIYSDAIWVQVPPVKEWADKPWSERKKSPFSAATKAQVEDYYFTTYVTRWAQAEPAAAFSSIPSMMMWDDHDIFDGWGSYPNDQLQCPMYQGIFEAARAMFRLFQLGLAENETRDGTIDGQNHFSYGFKVGKLGLLAVDMRSERSLDRVLSLKSWNAIRDWMDQLTDCTHLLLMSSIPVVHPDFSLLDNLLNILPGQQELEDDLKDHWTTLAHRQERIMFIYRLLAFAETKACRVTLLSGDVHVAAVGVIMSERTDAPTNARVINQLTSSAIVHPAPPAMALYFLESVGDKVETVDRGITAQMFEFPATTHRFIGARNWLSLEPDDQDRIWANWHVEGVTKPYTKVVHAVGAPPEHT